MKIAYFYMTGRGGALVERLVRTFDGMVFDKTNYKEGIRTQWDEADVLVFVMASGVVVRSIAPYIKSKTTDPAVIVMDQEGRHVISLLSGHLGGANEWAKKYAAITGGEAVITTATDVAQVPAMDVFAKENGLNIENIHELKYISGAMVEGRALVIYSLWPVQGQIPAHVQVKCLNREEMLQVMTRITTDSVVIATPSICGILRSQRSEQHILFLTRRPYCIGTGCKRDMDAVSYKESLEDFIVGQKLSVSDVAALATIELKKDEICMHTAANAYAWEMRIYTKDEVDGVDLSDASGKVIEASDFVKEITGVGSVSEACAWLGSGKGHIITGKTKYKGITFALAEETEALRI